MKIEIPIQSIYYCSNFPKSSVIKRTQKESDKAGNINIGRKSVKTEQLTKVKFIEGFLLLKTKNCITNESLDITWDICTRNRRSKRYYENFHKFLWCSTENCFRTATSPNLTSLKLEASLGTKMK
jgi:hypothetical protein